MRYPKYWSRVACRDWYETENKMWTCLSDKNAICEIDKDTKKARILGNYPQKRISEPNLSATVIGISEKIVFVPQTADDIAVYDRENDALIFIPVKPNHETYHEVYQEGMKFRRAFAYKNYVYLLGYSYPAIIQLNIDTLETNYLTDWIDIIEPFIEKGDNLGYFKEGYSFYGTQIYLPLGCCSGLMLFDLEDLKFKYIPVQGGTKGFGSLTDVDGTFYMTGRSGREHEIIIWNKYTESIRKIQIPVTYYYAPVVFNGKIFLFSFHGSSVLQLEEKSDSFKEYKLPEPFSWEKNVLDTRIMQVKHSGTGLKLQMGWSRKWYEVDCNTDVIVESIYNMEDESFLSQSWMEYCTRKVKETRKEEVTMETLPIGEYLMRMGDMEGCNDLQEKKIEACGNVIWSYLKTLQKEWGK